MMRQRPRISQGTIRSHIGTLLRGTTHSLGEGQSYADESLSNEAYSLITQYKLNVVRQDVKLSESWGENQMPSLALRLEQLDAAATLADNHNVYLMIMNSVSPGNYNKAELLEFWGVVAPQFADRPNVLFEMVNEPYFGTPANWQPRAYLEDPAVLADLHEVYSVMRSGAPDTLIGLFDFANISKRSEVYDVVRAFESHGPIDWTKTFIAFHWYYFVDPHSYFDYNPFDELHAVMQDYPLFMTETSAWGLNYWNNDPTRAVCDRLCWCENLGLSWIDLDGRGREEKTAKLAVTLQQMADSGYAWEADPTGGGEMATLVDGQSETWDLEPGIYEITEVVPAGWGLEIDGSPPPIPNGIRVTLNPGENLNMEFRNRLGSSITVTKATEPPGSTQEFEITVAKI